MKVTERLQQAATPSGATLQISFSANFLLILQRLMKFKKFRIKQILRLNCCFHVNWCIRSFWTFFLNVFHKNQRRKVGTCSLLNRKREKWSTPFCFRELQKHTGVRKVFIYNVKSEFTQRKVPEQEAPLNKQCSMCLSGNPRKSDWGSSNYFSIVWSRPSLQFFLLLSLL